MKKEGEQAVLWEHYVIACLQISILHPILGGR